MVKKLTKEEIKNFMSSVSQYLRIEHLDQYIDNDIIEIKADIRGASGGSCWDEDDDECAVEYYNYISIDENSNILKLFISHLVPGITDNDFRKIKEEIEKLCTIRDTHNNEYYGNYSEGEEQNIPLDVVYQSVNKILNR